MNSITIIGRLTRDPEYTEAKGDKSQRVNFTVAVDNTMGDLASFFDVVVFGKAADTMDKYLHKGKLVAVKGRMEQGDAYTDKNGNKRRSWSIHPETKGGVEFLSSGQGNTRANDKSNSNDIPDNFKEQEEDIPF